MLLMSIFLAGAMWSSDAFSAEVKVSGFLTAAAAKTSGLKDEPGAKAKYIERLNNDHINYADTHYGINIRTSLSEEWTAAGQLYASGAEENYNVILDWAFASYQPSPDLVANFGKIKFPTSMVSEVIDVGLLYPWIRPPQELYNLEAEGPNIVAEAFNGTTLIWRNNVGNSVVYLQPFIGSIPSAAGTKHDLTGLKLALEGDTFSAQVSHYSAEMEFETVTAWPEPYRTLEGKDLKVSTAGLNLDWNNIIVMGEYGSSKLDNNSETETKSYYATLGYRIGKVLPHITAASINRGEADEETGQKSTTVGIKYELQPDVALKAEWQKVSPDMNAAGESIFVEGAEEEDFNVYGIAINIVF